MIDVYETSGTSPTVRCMNFEPLLNDAETRGDVPHYRSPPPKQLAKRLERRRKQKARWAKKVRKLRAIEKRKAASAVSKAERAENERLKEERRQERYWQWRLKHHKEVVEAEKAKAFQEGYQLGLEVGRGQASSVQG